MPSDEDRSSVDISPVASLPALGAWAPPAERVPSLESTYRVSLCEGNKIISFKKFISPQPIGGPSKRKKNPGALGTCSVCPFVKTALHQPSGETGGATLFRSTLIGRPSVRLSRRSTAATAAGGFAVESHVGRRYRSIGAGALRAPCCNCKRSGAQQQMRVASRS